MSINYYLIVTISRESITIVKLDLDIIGYDHTQYHHISLACRYLIIFEQDIHMECIDH